jgi:hypothetical protein
MQEVLDGDQPVRVLIDQEHGPGWTRRQFRGAAPRADRLAGWTGHERCCCDRAHTRAMKPLTGTATARPYDRAMTAPIVPPCPACGGTLLFDTRDQDFSCLACGRTFRLAAVPGLAVVRPATVRACSVCGQTLTGEQPDPCSLRCQKRVLWLRKRRSSPAATSP